MADSKDPIEERVDRALRRAYRDGPEFMELRQAVEALKADRRERMSSVLDELEEAVAPAVKKAKALAEDIGTAFRKLGD